MKIETYGNLPHFWLAENNWKKNSIIQSLNRVGFHLEKTGAILMMEGPIDGNFSTNQNH